MSSLKSTIEGLASQFAISVIGALRSASFAEVMEVTSAGSGARAARVSGGGAKAGAGPRAAKRAKKVASAAPAPAKRANRPGRLGRRSLADIGRVIDDIASLLQKHPGGLRAEEIRRELGVQAKELPRPLADGLTAGRFTKQGQKRATTYFPGAGAKSSAAKSAPAKAAPAKPASPKSGAAKAGKGLPKKRAK